jgi:crotonobetainyl-CoA:carnitine CoA-transferase CaiB-like acyl-CoA transferase
MDEMDEMDERPAPLAGLRVVEVGTRIAAPFCAGFLGELGAEVIKVEDPAGGDFLRRVGPYEDGYSLSWAVEGRGRRSVTLDLRLPLGQELFRTLAATADVVVENFRPGTMERWHVGPADLDPRLVFVRISQFGQSGPRAGRPGLDRVAIAFGGLLHITGYPDRPPVRPGVTVADYLTGVFAAGAALAALRQRDRDPQGRGSVVDAPLYGSILRIMEWTIAAYDRQGVVRERHGNRLEHSAPLDNFPTADGRYVCVVAASDANFARLTEALGRPELRDDPRFAGVAGRADNADAIHEIVAKWCLDRTAEQAERELFAAGVPAAIAYTAADIAGDPHIAARGDLVTVRDPVLGPVRQQAPYPRLSSYRDRPVPDGAPLLGQHNDEVWGELLGAGRYRAAREAGAI